MKPHIILATLTIAFSYCLLTTAPGAMAQNGTGNGSAGLRTITSPYGYQIQVAADWQPQSSPRLGPKDTMYGSSDGLETVLVMVEPAPSGASVGYLLSQMSSLMGKFATSPGVSNFSVLLAPTPTSVPNAESAAIAGDQYTANSGTVYPVIAIEALRQGTQYVFTLQATADYSSQNADQLSQIVGSFQLVAGQGSASQGLGTITGPSGESFVAPSDWVRSAPSTVSEASVHSPDSAADASVVVNIHPGWDQLGPVAALKDQLSKGAIQPGMSGFTVTQQPKMTQVANADAAAIAGFSGTLNGVDEDGKIVAAVQGGTLYFFNLFATNTYGSAHVQQLAQMLSSFRLASSGSSAAIPAVTSPSSGPSLPPSQNAGVTPSTYIIQSSDTACQIAADFGVSIQELAQANATTASGLASLTIGQQLHIPAMTSSASGC